MQSIVKLSYIVSANAVIDLSIQIWLSTPFSLTLLNCRVGVSVTTLALP